MGEAKDALKRAFMEIASSKYKKRIIQALIVFVFLVLLAASVYYITVDDGTYKEDDWSSAPYAASQYTNGVSINDNGTFKTDMNVQELWDRMLKEKNRVNLYLDTPEELARLMKAELVTQYPDTRPEPDEEINWNEVKENADMLQGIIKFKRADTNDNRTTMKYMEPETFQGYIDEYNKTGSEEAKKEALTHFTLKKSSADTEITHTGPELYWPTDGTTITSEFGHRDEPTAGASSDHGAIDIGVPTGTNVYACEKGIVTTANFSNSAGNWVVIDHGNGYITKYMHNSELKVSAGDTVEKGQVIALSGSTGISTGPHVHFQIEANGIKVNPLSFKYHNGMGNGTGGFGISDDNEEKEENKEETDKKSKKDKKDKEKATQKAMATQVDGDGYKEVYTSSAGITYKHFKQFEGSYAGNAYWDGTISNSGCGPSSVAILASGLTSLDYNPGTVAAEMNSVYGLTSYMTLQGEMNSLGMQSEVIQSPSAETIQDNLRNGKVMLVSVNSNTIFTTISHIMALVDINEQGQVYVCNPGSSSLHGWYDIGEIVKGCQYIVVTEAGASGVAESKNTTNYVAVVATWNQKDTTVETNDANVGNRSSTEYSMSTTNVNYEEMVEPYTMPFDLLWALLVVGEDKEFIFELIDLVYGSEIEITVHDNLTINTDIDEWHYTKRTKAEVDGTITARTNEKVVSGRIKNDVHDPHSEEEYTTTKTVVTQTNTLSVALTKADVWIVKYTNEYTYVSPSESSNTNTITKEDEAYPSSPSYSENSYSCEHINAVKQELIEQLNPSDTEGAEEISNPVSFKENIKADYYIKNVNIYDNITNITKIQKYIQGVPILKEKIDSETAPNFISIFNKPRYRKNRHHIKDGYRWLFEIIEINNSANDNIDIDLIKFLIYKATEGKVNTGVDEFDFSIFKPGNFKPIGGSGGNLNIDALTKANLSKEEFVSLVQGYSAAISKGAGTAEFRNNASVIYDICVQNNINPVFCAAQAWREQNWDDPGSSPHNYWGIAVYNGQNYGSSWNTMEQAVQAYCDQVNSQASNGIYIERAQQYAGLDSRFTGDMSSIYDIFSAYCWKGDEYSMAENAKYVGDYVDSLSTIAQQIFGVGLM